MNEIELMQSPPQAKILTFIRHYETIWQSFELTSKILHSGNESFRKRLFHKIIFQSFILMFSAPLRIKL